MKIVASGPSRHRNLGGPSIFHGIVKVCRRVFPGCEMVYLDWSPTATVESEPDSDYPDVRILYGAIETKRFMYGAWRRRLLGSTGAIGAFDRKVVEELNGADLYIDAYGIEFCEKLTSPLNFKGAMLTHPLIHVAKLFGAKAVHYTASYGPATGYWTRVGARAILGKRCDLVYCREEQSRKYLLAWGIPADRLLVAPDTGLLLPSQPCLLEGLDLQRPRLGISVSHQIVRQWKSSSPYVDVIANVCDRAIRTWNAQVVLLPNELNDEYDDRAVARDVFDRIGSKESVFILATEKYSAGQQKGLISECDILLASRYHSVVAAMSSSVPTVVIGWHHKYAELLAHFGQENMGLSSENCGFESLWQRCEDVWNRREEIRGKIRSFVPGVENKIYEAGERLRGLLA